MRVLRGCALAALAVPLMALAPAAPKPPAAAAQVLGCDYPVNAHDTATSLLARYKGAKIDDVYVADSQERGVRLFPGQGGKEIDVTFTDEKMTHVEYVMTVGKSTWAGPKGLRLGSPMADVVAANGGRTLSISGFDWDYGGWVDDTHGGPLWDLAGKACTFAIRFETTKDVGKQGAKLAGEGVTLSSMNPLLIKAGPVVSEMSLDFETPRR